MKTGIAGGGHRPLEFAGEYICPCKRDGNRVTPDWLFVAEEEIVRCRDCEERVEVVTRMDVYSGEVAVGNKCVLTGMWVEPDGYCSWATRKGDEQ